MRIVGNNLAATPDTPDANLSDNLAYHIGFSQVDNQPLRDGSNLLVLKAAFLVMAITGSATLWMAVLADTGASVIVVANALRLLRAR